MTVLSPDISMLLWTIIALIHLALTITVAMQLINIHLLTIRSKCIWLASIALLPFIGPVFFILFRKSVTRIRLFLYNT